MLVLSPTGCEAALRAVRASSLKAVPLLATRSDADGGYSRSRGSHCLQTFVHKVHWNLNCAFTARVARTDQRKLRLILDYNSQSDFDERQLYILSTFTNHKQL